MTAKEHKQLTLKLQQVKAEVSTDASKAKELLMQTGFYTKKGELKKACR
jgi:hypothetical protein